MHVMCAHTRRVEATPPVGPLDAKLRHSACGRDA
jgi:hypothetical protein